MANTGVTQDVPDRVTAALAGNGVRLGAAAGVLLLAGLVVPWQGAALAALAAGAAVALLAAAGQGVALWQGARRHGARRTVARLAGADPTPAFLTLPDGSIGWRNAAAARRFPAPADRPQPQTLARLAADLFADPSGVIFRLTEKAQALGAVAEDVVTRRGHVRLTAVDMAGAGTFWRLDEVTETRPSTRGAEALSLPMMIVSRTGTILFMNEALRRVMGGRPRHLDRVVTDLPLRPGGLHDLSGAEGPVRCRVAEVPGPSGRSEIYFLPAGGPGAGETETLERLPVALVQLDRKGRIVAANRLARDLLGGGEGATLSERLEGLGRPIPDWLAEAVAGRGLGRSEVLRVRGIEAERYLQVTLGQVTGPGEVRLIAVLSDATELKTLEAQFVQSQKMQAIGQLAGGVAHDFNNLLTAISGHCDLLLFARDEGDPDYADLVQINQNSNRAAGLVGQLLAYSRKQTLQPQVVDLRDTLADLTYLLDRLVGERVKLVLQHEPGVPTVRADRRQLEQVIMNLVVNARDAMPAGGEIRITTRPLVLEEELLRDRAVVPAGRYALIRVEDHGIGIPPDRMQKIFEPFFTTKRVGEGTGLGLSTAYGIVKQSGGFIFADSVVGMGTVFTVYLPALADPVAEAPAPSPGRGVPEITWPEPVAPRQAGAPAPGDEAPDEGGTPAGGNEPEGEAAAAPVAGAAAGEVQPEDRDRAGDARRGPDMPGTGDDAAEGVAASPLAALPGDVGATDRLLLSRIAGAVMEDGRGTRADDRGGARDPAGQAPEGTEARGTAVDAGRMAEVSQAAPPGPAARRKGTTGRWGGVRATLAAPDAPETARELLAALPADPPGDEGTVLLVEDEAPVRAFAARALRLRGYTVLEAEDAEEALRILEDPGLEVDVFVTDVIMPGLDGPTWVRRARESRPDTRVVFVSGYAEDCLDDHDARVPNSVFLPKPFSLRDLTTMVEGRPEDAGPISRAGAP